MRRVDPSAAHRFSGHRIVDLQDGNRRQPACNIHRGRGRGHQGSALRRLQSFFATTCCSIALSRFCCQTVLKAGTGSSLLERSSPTLSDPPAWVKEVYSQTRPDSITTAVWEQRPNLAEKLTTRMVGLSVLESRVLLNVHAHPLSTPTEISARIMLTPVQVGRCVARLSQLALVSISAHVADGRSIQLKLTKKGCQGACDRRRHQGNHPCPDGARLQ